MGTGWAYWTQNSEVIVPRTSTVLYRLHTLIISCIWISLATVRHQCLWACYYDDWPLQRRFRRMSRCKRHNPGRCQTYVREEWFGFCNMPRQNRNGLNRHISEIQPSSLARWQYEGLWCFYLPIRPGGPDWNCLASFFETRERSTDTTWRYACLYTLYDSRLESYHEKLHYILTHIHHFLSVSVRELVV